MVFLLFLILATVFSINAKTQQPTLPSNRSVSVHEAIRILEEVVKEEKVVEQFCYKHYCEIKEDKVRASTTEKPSTTGQTPRSFSCADLYQSGYRVSGEYLIDLKEPLSSGLDIASVYCDMKLDGGGWTVMQRRGQYKVRENFYRNWTDYDNGFGDMEEEFWLGNEIIHRLTTQENVTLRITMTDFNEKVIFANYGKFQIADEKNGYRLLVGNYTGDAGNSLDFHNRMKFSTYDQDDVNGCARRARGAWWFNSDGCIDSHLNGEAYEDGKDRHGLGIVWGKHNLKSSVMKIRPVNFKKGRSG